MKRYCDYWRLQAEWWGSRSFEWWAAHITAVYVGGAIVITGSRFEELILLKLNEIGDLAAGVFGPVAFLWLVLGYIQQGRELKLSSEALRMQAEELKELVRGQNQLVDANEHPFEPAFRISIAGTVATGGKVVYRLVNNGYRVHNVVVYFICDNNRSVGKLLGEMEAGVARDFDFDEPNANGLGGLIQVVYLRVSQKEGFQNFTVSPMLGVTMRIFGFPRFSELETTPFVDGSH